MLRRLCVVGLSAAFLLGCTSNYVSSSSFEGIKSQPDISQTSNGAGTAKVGQYLFRQADQHKIEGITLLSDIKIKPKSILKPNVFIPAQNLSKTATKQGYDYYVAQTTESLKADVINAIKIEPTQNKGIKMAQNGSDIQVFMIAGNREHSYPLPKEVRWEKTSIIDLDKLASENSLKYMGIEGDNLLFRHVKTNNVVKKNLFSSSSKATLDNLVIKVPKINKSFNIEDKTIHIVAANANEIQFRTSTMKG